MLINKSIKKFILLSLLLTLPVQTMSMPIWGSFSSMKESVTQLFLIMRKTFEWHKAVATVALGSCVAICLSKIYSNRKKAAKRIAEEREAEEARRVEEEERRKALRDRQLEEAREVAEQARQLEEAVAAETRIKEARKVNASKAANAIAEFFANKKAEAEKEAEETRIKKEREAEEACRKEINSIAERRCFICLAEKHETTEKLLPEVKCLSGTIHPGKIHKKCLRKALGINGKCPLCCFSPSLQMLLERERRRREEEQRDLEELKRAQEELQIFFERGRIRREEEDEDDQKFVVDMASRLLHEKERKRKKEEEEDQKCMEKVRRRLGEGTQRILEGRKRRKEEEEEDQSAFEGVRRKAEEAQRQRELEARILAIIERL